MSGPIAEAFVRLRPDPSTFRAEADAQIRAQLQQLRIQAPPIDFGGSADRLRAETATLRAALEDVFGEEIVADALRSRDGIDALSEGMAAGGRGALTYRERLLLAAEGARDASGAIRALATAAPVAEFASGAQTIRSESASIRAALEASLGPELVSNLLAARGGIDQLSQAFEATGQQALTQRQRLVLLLESTRDMRSRVDELARAEVAAAEASAARASSFGSVAAGAARIGAATFAIAAGYQAMQRLEGALRTTGEEAFTTEGRLRNLGAALLNADIVGAIDAMRRSPETLEDLGISAQEAAARLEALEDIAFGVSRAAVDQATGTEQASEAVDNYNRIAREAGTTSQDLAAQLVEQGRAWRELAGETRRTIEETLRLRNAQGSLAVSPLLQDVGTRPAIGPTTFGVSTPGRSRQSEIEEELQAAQRNDDLRRQLVLLEERERIQRSLLRAVEREGPLAEQRRAALQATLNQQDSIADLLRRQREAERETARAQAEAAAQSAASIQENRLLTNQQLAQLTDAAADDRAATAALVAFYQAKAADTDLTEEARASYADKARLAAAQGEVFIANERVRLRQEAIDNRLAAVERRQSAAELTASLNDNIRLAREEVRLLRQAANDQELSRQARQAYRDSLGTAEEDLAELLNRQQTERDELELMRIGTQRLRAQLTVTETDDEAAIRSEIAFWQNALRRRGLSEREREQFRQNIERGRIELQNLQGNVRQGTTAFELLQQNVRTFQDAAGNIDLAGDNFRQPLTGFDFTSSLQAFLRRQQPSAAAPEFDLGGRDRRFGGGRTQTDAAIDRLVEALDRNTDARTGRRSPGSADFPVSNALSRNDRRFEAARDTREALESSGGGF